MANPVLKALYGISVSVTSTPQPLLPLLQSVDSSLNAILQNVGTCQLQADPGNGATNILIGDSALAAGRYGCSMTAGAAQYLYREGMAIPLSALYVMVATGTAQLNVLIVIG
jgi:hypothetical protein